MYLITPCKQSTYTWTAKKISVLDGISADFPLNERTTTTGANGRYLVVRTGELLPFYDYEFTLTVSNFFFIQLLYLENDILHQMSDSDATGVSKLILHANKPPSNGVCQMKYEGEHVYVLETLVRYSKLMF